MYDKYKNKKKQSISVAGLHSSSAPMLRVLKKRTEEKKIQFPVQQKSIINFTDVNVP